MKVNANYTWIKCTECGLTTRILPAQKFNSPEDFAKLFECDCKIEKPTKKKVVTNAA